MGEWSDSGCILKVKVVGLPAGLSTGCKQKRGLKDDSKIFGLNN